MRGDGKGEGTKPQACRPRLLTVALLLLLLLLPLLRRKRGTTTLLCACILTVVCWKGGRGKEEEGEG